MRTTAAFVLASAILETLGAGIALAQTGSVLGVVPEGAVIDVAQLPDLRPGARVGFLRSDGSATEVAQGSVTDVRDGRALIKLKPGGAVQVGDVALPCAALSGPGSQADLRTSFQGLKAQLARAGGGAPEVQAVVAQLESALDARETAIRDGACDVTAHDQQIVVLTTQVQQVMAAAAPSPGNSPSPAAPAAGSGVPPSSSSGVVVPSQQGATQNASQQDPMDKAMELVKRLFQMAQSKGVKRGGSGSSAGQQADPSSPMSGSAASAPPSSSPALAPADPGAGAPNPPSPGASAPGPSAGPPAGGGSPGAPPGTGPAPAVSVPPGLGSSQPPAGGAQPPAGSSGPPGQPPAWWTIPKLKPPPSRIVGAAPGATSGTPGSATAPALTPPPGATPLPGVAHLRIVTIHGGVQTERGSAIPNALITIAGRHISTGPNGEFRLFGVPAGRHTLVVTAAGYRERSVTLDLSSGEPDKVTLTLQPHTVSPPASPQRSGGQRPGSGSDHRLGVQHQSP